MQANPENKSPESHASCVPSPNAAQLHLFTTEYGPHLLAVNGSRIYQVEEESRDALEEAMNTPDPRALDTVLEELGLDAPSYINDDPPDHFPVRALSLAIAQQCNLGCTYCYAQGGDFGSTAKTMTTEVAYAAVERLLEDVSPNERVQLSFLGGEPLVNRPALQAATRFAVERATAKQVKIGFSLTTNGTLLTPEDATFFEQYGFAVTVSLDGVGQIHDVLRPFKGGRGSYKHIIQRVRPLLDVQRHMQVSARVTVTPQNLELRHTLDTLVGLGFHSVGFSPMLSSRQCTMELWSLIP